MSQLLRLKQQLSVRSDKEVAELLGLSARAFHGRKERGAFPKEELLVLKQRMPQLDVDYVLYGTTAAERLGNTERLLDFVKLATDTVTTLDLPVEDQRSLQLVLFAIATKNSAMVRDELARLRAEGEASASQVFNERVGQAAGRDITNHGKGKKK
ncbi:helix-turn-helix domain-containing protein [Lysobacter sp. CA199]|uniref:helix-turn-helix domain-containing protein n=1 Tax=Lysobacter sp. CA199 TaxID=3455608 RepID=UPI003F8CF429